MNNPSSRNRRILLASYPQGSPAPENFSLEDAPVGEPQAGEVVVKTLYLSMDPFPRLRMQPAPRMGPPLPLGSVVIGRGVGKVIAANDTRFAVGDYVSGDLGWQEYCVCRAETLRAVDPSRGPVRASLGVLGPSGIAAYIALFDSGEPRSGDTVLVTAAAGAVGSIAGQLARLHGCRVVGICLGDEQAQYLRELGFDAVVDAAASTDLQKRIFEACPAGVDVLLDSVGGDTHNAAVMNMNPHGRIVAFGFISAYNLPGGSEPEYGRMYEMIRRRLQLRGFLVGDHLARFPAALNELSRQVLAGRLQFREHITQGLESAPAAFAALFCGGAPGKRLVQVAADE